VARYSSISLLFDKWFKFLDGDPDEEFMRAIFEPGGGLRIVNDDVVVPASFVPNYASVLDCEDFIHQDIMSELQKGFIARVAERPYKVNALGAVRKSEGKYRRITDLSRPKGGALNEFIDLVTFQFKTVDDACEYIMKNPRVFGCKFDIEAAYRHVPIWPGHWHYLGFEWQGAYYIDLRLCFGLASAPYVFWRISNVIVRVGYKFFGVAFVLPYIDDFLVLSTGTSTEEAQINARADYLNFRRCMTMLGWPIAEHKVVEPCQDVTFLGIRINMRDRVISLPEDKLSDLLRILEEFNGLQLCTKRELERLIGKLNFGAKVIRGGRTFLRRMIILANSVPERHHKVVLDDEFRADVDWWFRFAHSWNGKAVMLDPDPIDNRRFVVDASNAAVCAVFDQHFIIRPHDPVTASWHINDKECLAVFLAALKWAPEWSNKRVVVSSDNQTTVSAINKGTSSSPSIMRMLRALFWLSAKHNFHLIAVHIPGRLNTLADAGSRLNFDFLLDEGLSMQPCPMFDVECL